MTYIPDGSLVDFKGWQRWLPWTEGKTVVAMGWLRNDRPYSVGDTPAAFQERLLDICRFSRHRLVTGGLHACEMCGRWLGSDDLFIEADEKMFWAPVLIHHYVAVHRYSPPSEFVQAVMRRPRLSAPEYETRSGSERSGIHESTVDQRSHWNYDASRPRPEDDIPEWRKALRRRLRGY
jgi:hypothetical protein